MNKAKNAVPPPQRTRDKQGRFVKGDGVCGNPKGRPKLRQEFKQFAQEKSLDTLKEVWSILIGAGEKTSDRLTAARIMLEYGYGRPAAELDRERLDLDMRRLAMDEKKAEFEQREAAGDKEIRIVLTDEVEELIG